MNQEFAKELKELFKKHGVFMGSGGKLVPMQDYKINTLKVTLTDSINYGNGVKDKSGVFVVTEIDRKPEKRAKSFKSNTAFQIVDKEKPLGGEAVESPVDGKMYTNRAAYDRHLKENGCHIVDDSRKATADKIDRMKSMQKEALSTRGVDFAWH